MARYLENKGNAGLAASFLEKAADSGESSLKDEAFMSLGKLHKKAGNHDEAQSCFARVSNNSAHSIQALCEMAKHQEHREKNLEKALELTNRALAIGRNSIVLTGQQQNLDDLRKRAQRLVSKRMRQGNPGQ
jgi:hypothetical protein